jgi:hypothetical protein
VAGAERGEDGVRIAARACELDGLARERSGTRAAGGVVELDREASEQARPQRRCPIAEHLERLLERVGARGVQSDDCHADASAAERRARYQFGVVQGPRRLVGAGERGIRARIGAPGLRVAEREQQLEPLPAVFGPSVLERVEGSPVVGGCLLVGERGERPLPGEPRRSDRPLGAVDAASGERVMGELGWVDALHSLECVGDAAVQARPSEVGQLFIQRRSHELVLERPDARAGARYRTDQPRRLRDFERIEQASRFKLARAGQ